MSVNNDETISALGDTEKQAVMKMKRANSIHTFEAPKIKGPNPEAVARQKLKQEALEKLKKEREEAGEKSDAEKS